MRQPTRFTSELFEFLSDIESNNNRPWFEENRERYERHLKEAALAFIEGFAPHLEELSPRFVADPGPVGGSLFRIHRDMRFAKDRRPYKTHVGIRFPHERARDVHAPGYYLHLALDGVWAGCGVWRPDSGSLRRIREAIVDDPDAWRRARDAESFRRTWTLAGESLVRGPRGFDPGHPLIGDLKRKEFIGHAPLEREAVLHPGFVLTFARMCRDAEPFMRYLCGVLELPY